MAGVWSNRLISLLLLSISVAIPLVWITAGYMDLPVTEILSFVVRDGFLVKDGSCPAGSEPLGAHCFSDFTIISWLLASPSFWSPDPTPYPPSGWIVSVSIYLAFHWLGGLTLATTVYLIVALAAALVPALWVAKGNWSGRGPIAILVLGLGAAPVLGVIDRGNSLALAIPSLLAFSVGLMTNKRKLIIVGAVVTILLKPHMVLLVFALIALRRFRDAVIVVAASVAGILLSFLVWPGDRLENIQVWISNIAGYSDYGGVLTVYPYNISATRSLLAVFDFFGFSALFGELNRAHLQNLLENHSSVPGILFLAVATVIVLRRRSRVDPLTALFLAVSLIIIVPGTSWYYYLVLFVPVAALILKDPRISEKRGPSATATFLGCLDAETRTQSKAVACRNWTIVLVITFSFCLWVIPVPGSVLPGGFEGTLGLVQIFWGPVVVLGVVIVLISLLFDRHVATQDITSRHAESA